MNFLDTIRYYICCCFYTSDICKDCAGVGKMITIDTEIIILKCNNCRGSGSITKRREDKIRHNALSYIS
jgi:DnaJ-class molecular chaperone